MYLYSPFLIAASTDVMLQPDSNRQLSHGSPSFHLIRYRLSVHTSWEVFFFNSVKRTMSLPMISISGRKFFATTNKLDQEKISLDSTKRLSEDSHLISSQVSSHERHCSKYSWKPVSPGHEQGFISMLRQDTRYKIFYADTA